MENTNENIYTLKKVYLEIRKKLLDNNIEDSDFNAYELIKFVFGYDKNYLIVNPFKELDNTLLQKLYELVDKRIQGVPLQYIIGVWSFGDLDFFVGDGVLIPRDDTQVLVDHSIKSLKENNIQPFKILDLCSGSGIIAITLAKSYPNASVFAVELSQKAFVYLEKNINYNNALNVKAIKADVLKDFEEISQLDKFDLIISNPPYIITKEIESLQKEVQFEPFMALDGGEDGYLFYREIIKNYTNMLNKNGILSFELGENQYDYVENLMKNADYKDINYMLDFGNCKRSILGVKI